MVNKKSLENLRPFKPGQRGNPAGRAGVLPPEVRAERKRNQSSLIKTITELFLMTDQDAEAKMAKPETNQLTRAVQSMIAKSREGETTAFKYLVELMVGKIPETDYDGFTEEDLRILNRVKEVFYEQDSKEKAEKTADRSVGSGH